jgi:hypothetical protein
MITDTRNLHTLRWLADTSGIPLSSLYHYAKTGALKIVKIDNVALVAESNLPDWIKVEINKKHNEKVQDSGK